MGRKKRRFVKHHPRNNTTTDPHTLETTTCKTKDNVYGNIDNTTNDDGSVERKKRARVTENRPVDSNNDDRMRSLSDYPTVYNDIMTNRGYQMAPPNSEVKSEIVMPPFSWLRVVRSVTRNCGDNAKNDEQQQQQQQQAQKLLLRHTTTINKNRGNHEEMMKRIRSELPSLETKLNDLKNRLWPAAVKRSDNNNNNDGNDDDKSSSPGTEFYKARAACNPLEKISRMTYTTQDGKERGFVCRSAMKLANIDALLGFTFTEGGSLGVSTSPTFVFVDLCGAPGGFTEYLLRNRGGGVGGADAVVGEEDGDEDGDGKVNEDKEMKRRGEKKEEEKRIELGSESAGNNTLKSSTTTPCYGYGMSLHGTNKHGSGISWNLKTTLRHLSNKKGCKTSSARPLFRVCTGSDGTGDIYNWDNVQSLYDTINRDQHSDDQCSTSVPLAPTSSSSFSKPTSTSTKTSSDHHYIERGLADLIVADGGFDAQRSSPHQERLTLSLVASQTAAALHLLRRNGHFLLKMFGFRTEGVRKIMRFLYDVFGSVVVVKPVASRPASAERYVVCLGYEGRGEGWDAKVWRDEVLDENAVELGKDHGYDDDEGSDGDGKSLPLQKEKGLDNFIMRDALDDLLDLVDFDMLHLNIQACERILVQLETPRSTSGNLRKRGRFRDNEREVNISSYKRSWRLGCG